MHDSPRHTRAQSEALGVALLVGIAVVGAVAVAVTGFAAIDGGQERVGMDQAERALSGLDVRATEVAFAEAGSARVDLGLPDSDGSASVRPDEGWLRVQYTDLTGIRDPNDAVVANVTLGAVVYQQGSRTVGLQGGGVFRSNGNGSVVVSRPEFHYRNGTLSIPVVSTGGGAGVASTIQVTPNGTTRAFPDPARNLTNKVDNTTVVVTVKSRYYRAWADHFRSSTSGIVTVNDTANTASVQFISLPDDEGVGGGIIATAEGGDLALVGTGAYVDAYNSSNGPYTNGSDDGVVKAVGNIRISADATIDGNVKAGKDVRIEQNASEITGDAGHTGEFVNDGVLGGTNYTIDGVPTVLPIDTLVIKRFQDIRATNTNDRANAVSGVDLSDGELTVSRGERVELGPGNYSMERLRVDGGTLVLDTTDGNISMGIEDWMRVQKAGSDPGNVTVKGDGVVEIYLTSRETTRVSFTGSGNAPTRDLNFYVGTQSRVHVPGDVSPRFRVYAPQVTNVAIAGSSSGPAEFTGLFYAPDGLDLSGSIYVKQADVYGGLVSGQIVLGQNGAVHYDRNLDDLVVPRASRISRLEYMHVVVHRIDATAG